MELSVVVPVYRSGSILPETHKRLTAAVQKITAQYEILYIDDCSRDGTWEVLQKLARSDRRVRCLLLTRNFGQHPATLCGIRLSRGRFIVTMDDDLEHPPESIGVLLAKVRQGYDLVYGVFRGRTHSGWRNFTSEVARRLFRVAIPNLNADYTSYRAFHGALGRNLAAFESPFPFVDGYLSWITNNVATVDVPHGRRGSGSSHYSFGRLLTHTMNIFVSFSDLPLRFASWIGLTAFGAGSAALVWVLYCKFRGITTVSGYASLMAGIMAFGGMQMILLGIYGEYLGRINFKTSKKPLYLVSRREGFDGPRGGR